MHCGAAATEAGLWREQREQRRRSRTSGCGASRIKLNRELVLRLSRALASSSRHEPPPTARQESGEASMASRRANATTTMGQRQKLQSAPQPQARQQRPRERDPSADLTRGSGSSTRHDRKRDCSIEATRARADDASWRHCRRRSPNSSSCWSSGDNQSRCSSPLGVVVDKFASDQFNSAPSLCATTIGPANGSHHGQGKSSRAAGARTPVFWQRAQRLPKLSLSGSLSPDDNNNNNNNDEQKEANNHHFLGLKGNVNHSNENNGTVGAERRSSYGVAKWKCASTGQAHECEESARRSAERKAGPNLRARSEGRMSRACWEAAGSHTEATLGAEGKSNHRNKSTVIKAKKLEETKSRKKRAENKQGIGHLKASTRNAPETNSTGKEAGLSLSSLFLLLEKYLFFFCDKICPTNARRKRAAKRPAMGSGGALWLLVLLLLGCWIGLSPPPQELPLIVRASAAQIQAAATLAPPAPKAQAITGGLGGALATHESPQTTRTEELKSAVLATMTATQSTLSELNASLPRPHYLPAAPNGQHQDFGDPDQLAADSTALFPEGRVAHDDELAPLESGPSGELPEQAAAAGPGANASSPARLGGSEQGDSIHSGYLQTILEIFSIFIMVAIIIGDICGNSLVILSVCRHSKLRVTTNWFVVSLACADILVALFAMTFNASVIIWGRWLFKPWVCDFWNSCDVLASTASILHLCCISIDRYIAIMRPLDYPMKITTKRVMYALCGVWISSALLSYIPIFTGVYTTSEHIEWRRANPDQCEFVVNRVYAIVSSSISFWIPCCIMVFTYYRIYREATRQEKFIYKAQSMMPAPMVNHHSSNHKSKQRRSKSMAAALSSAHHPTSGGGSSSALPRNNNGNTSVVAAQANERIKSLAATAKDEIVTTELNVGSAVHTSSLPQVVPPESEPLTSAGALELANNSSSSGTSNALLPAKPPLPPGAAQRVSASQTKRQQQQPQPQDDDDDRDSNSGQSTPTKRSISKMKREHKAAKTLGIIMGVFILCWLPFFSWYTPQHICGSACEAMLPKSAVTLLFWIGYFNSTLNPIIYAYFNHEFRDAFKKTLQWIFCCCQDLKCLRVNRPNDNQHYNCTYRSTQEIGLVTNG